MKNIEIYDGTYETGSENEEEMSRIKRDIEIYYNRFR